MKVPVYNLEGKKIDEMEVSEEIFGRKWNPDLVHQALLAQTANRRKIIAHAKGRSEVSGGGRKPWRQKGTGRARHGSIRSPLWRGGGVTHGPIKEKQYGRKINKKMKRFAIQSVVSKKLAEQELKFIDSFGVPEQKTKLLDQALKKFLAKPKKNKNLSVLLIPGKDNKIIFRISANIPKVKSLHPNSLNIEDLLKYKNILVERNAVSELK